MIAYSPSFAVGGAIPERDTFAALGATVAKNFGVAMPPDCIGEPMDELLAL